MSDPARKEIFISYAATLLPKMAVGEYRCPHMAASDLSETLEDRWVDAKFDRNTSSIALVYESVQRFLRERPSRGVTGLLSFPHTGKNGELDPPMFRLQPRILNAYDDLPPLPDSDSLEFADVFQDRLIKVYTGYRETLSFDLLQGIIDYKNSPKDSPKRNVFEAANELAVDYLALNDPIYPGLDDMTGEGREIFEFLVKGVVTGAEQALGMGLVGMLLYLVERERTPSIEKLAELVRNSSPAASKIASVNKEHFAETDKLLGVLESDLMQTTANFILVDAIKGEGIDIRRESLVRMQKALANIPLKSRTSGCIALFPYRLIPKEFRTEEVKPFANTIDAMLNTFADVLNFEGNPN